MTPAVNYLKKNKVPHSLQKYKHDPDHPSFGLEAAEKLNLNPEQVFKTLVTQLESGALAVAILPVTKQLDLKQFAKACGVKKAAMADKTLVEKTTGYILGGVSPLGQKKRLRTLLDNSAGSFSTIYVSGGKRGLEIELSPQDLIRHTSGSFSPIT